MSERVISDPTVAGWELDPATGYWMWAAGGGSIQDGDTEGQITTWDGTEWTPEGAVVVDANGNVGIGTASQSSYYAKNLVVSAGSEGGVTIASTNTTNNNYIHFADGTNGDESYRGQIGYAHNGDQLSLSSAGGVVFNAGGFERITIAANGNVNISGKLFINGEEVTAGGGASLWTDNGDGTISSTKTAKAPDFVTT